jgi:hypothetical protein
LQTTRNTRETGARPQADESGSPVSWGEHVADQQYAQAPEVTEMSE